MNRKITLFAMIAAMFAVSSCSKKDVPTGNEVEQDYVFSAIINDSEDAGTKVSLDGAPVGGIQAQKWDADDRICVIDASGFIVGSSEGFAITEGAGTKTATFSGKKYFGQGNPAYAVYPVSACSVADNGYVTFALAAEQDGTIGNAIMLGKIVEKTITFSNACSVIKMQVGETSGPNNYTGDKAITSISVGATKIAGKFTSSDFVSLTPSSDAVDEITVTPASGETFTSGSTIYIPIFPAESSTDISLTFTNKEGAVASVTVDGRKYRKNYIKDLGTAGAMKFTKTIEIKTLSEFLTFSNNVNNGSVDYSGATIDITCGFKNTAFGVQEDFVNSGLMIEDTHGVLNDATLNFNNDRITFGGGEFAAILNTNGGGILFNNLSSDNVTICGLGVRGQGRTDTKIYGCNGCFGGLVGNYTGNRLVLQDCTVSDLCVDNITGTPLTFGALVGKTSGDVIIEGFQFSSQMISNPAGDIEYEGVIGYATGDISLSFKDVYVQEDIGIASVLSANSKFGVLLGYGAGSLTVNITDCSFYGMTVYGPCAESERSSYYYICPGSHGSEDVPGDFPAYVIGGKIDGATVNFDGYHQSITSYCQFTVK